MGQTLTHGIYLPDEGERNCYDGLAGNWQLLDGAVGTIAEHSTQIAGKAPLVHTHTKSQITDFPTLANVATSGSYNDLNNIPASFTPSSHTHGNITNDGKVGTTANKPLITGTGGAVQAGSFGTAANTFCEGNDSRLSDARTPVAHTHTKSDVTDLLNSNFIPSANNSYDLGSSSYQWNNIYAKNYYYNGTAWGLDKSNWWSLAQFYAQNSIHVRKVEPGVAPSSEVTAGFRMENANASYVFCDVLCRVSTGGTTYVMLSASNKFTNGALDPNGTTASRGLQVGIRSNGTGFLYTDCGWRCNLVPPLAESGVYNLGTSTNKWKTFNGINPGALSLPDVATTWEDTTGYVLDGTTENLMPLTDNFAVPGWICFRVTHTLGTESFITVEQPYRVWATSDKDCVSMYTLWVPCKPGTQFRVKCKADSLQVRFHPCMGNV